MNSPGHGGASEMPTLTEVYTNWKRKLDEAAKEKNRRKVFAASEDIVSSR
jgi:hypothetical protein